MLGCVPQGKRAYWWLYQVGKEIVMTAQFCRCSLVTWLQETYLACLVTLQLYVLEQVIPLWWCLSFLFYQVRGLCKISKILCWISGSIYHWPTSNLPSTLPLLPCILAVLYHEMLQKLAVACRSLRMLLSYPKLFQSHHFFYWWHLIHPQVFAWKPYFSRKPPPHLHQARGWFISSMSVALSQPLL